MASKTRRGIKKPKIVCVQCKLEVEEEDDTIQCDKCTKTLHAVCTVLDKRQYQHLLQNREEEYVCHICNEEGGSIKNELNKIKTKLNKLDQLDCLQKSIQFMSEKFDDMVKCIDVNKEKLEALQKENLYLKDEINNLKMSVKFLDNDRVRNDCIINGVDAKRGSNAIETVVKMMKEVGLDLNPKEIDDAYFLKQQDDKNKQSVVVKFTNKKSKQNVMSTKPKLKAKDGTKEVFINDYLSRETLTLLKYAKRLKEVGYRRVYPMAGKVFTKMTELSKPKLIKDADEVDSLVIESSQKRRSLRRCKVAEANPSVGEEEADDSSSSTV